MGNLKIIIQPIGITNAEDVDYLAENLSKSFPFDITIFPVIWSMQPPYGSYNIERMQYNADLINNFLANYYKDYIKDNVYVLGIAGFDGYYEGLNFVFGLANIDLRVATVYTERLKDAGSLNIYKERLLKESIHELGHLFGLGHCKNKGCVMNFSNNLEEVDKKGKDFCEECKLKLKKFKYQLQNQ
ncbi:MAG: archaemetzincin family Zn-dependent metalloprotease [Caldisphaera sp.]|jgi:archaemetzincin|nr:archaemetzincin family Zn-dependent metalloprotease [Caldisphaera sp.]PMP90384.1 MAG: archemetzincin [Caldisphaera sp.]